MEHPLSQHIKKIGDYWTFTDDEGNSRGPYETEAKATVAITKYADRKKLDKMLLKTPDGWKFEIAGQAFGPFSSVKIARSQLIANLDQN